MKSKNGYTKESIKSRMFNRAAALWDIRDVDSLDPLVKLLVESLASEIFKLSGEIQDIENRILEKLARVFTPSHMLSASPAHTVVHARAQSGTCPVNNQTEFLYKDPQFMRRHSLRRLVFTPVCQTTLIDGDIVHMIGNGRFYNMNSKNGKEHIANAIQSDPIFNNTVWLGLECGRHIKSLKDLSFYFDLPFMGNDKEGFFRLLNYGKWSHAGESIGMLPGLQKAEDITKSPQGESYGRGYLDRRIVAIYDCRFQTIADELLMKSLQAAILPKELEHLFDTSLTSSLMPVIWIKLELPPAFDHKTIDQLEVQVNCVPVTNIFLKAITGEVTPLLKIVPLSKDDNEFFLSVKSVTDSDDKTYKQVREHIDDPVSVEGTFTVRRGGTERFNAINAKDYLIRLMELFRDESVAFSSTNKDILEQNAGDLLEMLSEFEQKMSLNEDDREQTSYLILGNNNKKANLSIKFNLTNGEIANNIRAGDLLGVPEMSDIEPSSVYFVTGTRGGGRSLSENRQKDMYKYMLTSHGTIYTRDDVVTYCNAHFGDYFSSVQVKKGYEVSSLPKEGVIKTTEIVLVGLRAGGDIKKEDIIRDLLAGLEQNSPEGMNYRIVQE